MSIRPLSPIDVRHVLDATSPHWNELKGERLFITGGTGFFGVWLLESFIAANERYGLGATAVVLTRSGAAFAAKAPHLARHPAVTMIEGDVRSFEFPVGSFRFVIHAATQASARLNEEQPLQMLDSIVEGTRRTLEFAVSAGTRKFLLTSSGAVYGRQPSSVSLLTEEQQFAPSPIDPRSAYAEGKRVAELLGAIYTAAHPQLEVKIARCFAFAGPHLPLDAHFAIGNFIRDVLEEKPIRIAGDGTPLRSYLYASDMAVWLWTILFAGRSLRPYNVGSENAVSIAELARVVAAAGSGQQVIVGKQADPAVAAERYLPSTARARNELGLLDSMTLAEIIGRTVRWHRGDGGEAGDAALYSGQ